MSRIGNNPVKIPNGVKVNLLEGNELEVIGPKGSLKKVFSPLINIEVKENEIAFTRKDEKKHTKQLHGTTRALVDGMVEGVSKGFEKNLLIKGIGYKARMEGKDIVLNVGFSHPVLVETLNGAEVSLESNTKIKVSGIDKQIVGQMAALIRSKKEPEPYGGKGIMYVGEKVRRKTPRKKAA